MGDRAEVLQGDRQTALKGCSHNMLRRWSEKFRLVSHFDKKLSLNEDVYLEITLAGGMFDGQKAEN